jgi:hypothetical protein
VIDTTTEHHPAQTNLQLYNQLLALSWPVHDLERVRAGYEFMDELFRGLHRGSGKTFVAHLLGTASVAASVDGRRDVVLAGLMHAAYTGGGTEITSDAPPRSTVSSIMGDDAEALVYAYATSPWGPDALADAIANVEDFGELRRDVVLLRLANEIDERADLGTRFNDKGGFLRAGDDELETLAALADRLPCPKLAAGFRKIFDEQHGVEVPPVLRASARTTPVRIPGSSASRVSSSVRDVTRRGRRLLASVPGARAARDALRGLRTS